MPNHLEHKAAAKLCRVRQHEHIFARSAQLKTVLDAFLMDT